MGGRPHATILAAVLAWGLPGLGTCGDGRNALRNGTIPRVPVLSPPPPVPPADRTPLPVPFRVTFENLRYVTDVGTEIVLPRGEAVYLLATTVPHDGGPLVHARTLRLHQPRITFPVDTVVSGLDLFFPLLGPRARVDRFVVTDGTVGTLAHPSQYAGRWLWRMRGVDLAIEDLVIGGSDGEPESFHVIEASGAGEVRGRPLRIAGASARIERTPDLLTASLEADLGRTQLAIDARMRRGNTWRLQASADPFAFGELRTFVPVLPEAGTGELAVIAQGTEREATITFERAQARLGTSRVALHGSISAGDDVRLDGVVLQLLPLRANDLERATGGGIPGDGAWRGSLHADGGLRSGLMLGGGLEYHTESGDTSRLSLSGHAQVRPEARLALNITGTPVRLADTAFVVSVSARGSLDSLRIRGSAALTDRTATERGDRIEYWLTPRSIRERAGDGTRSMAPAPPTRPPNHGDGRARAPADRGATGYEGRPTAEGRPRRLLPRLVATLDALVLNPAGRPPRVTGRARIRSIGSAPTVAPGGRRSPSHSQPAPRSHAPVLATVTGSAILAHDGAVAVRITADALPLALVPVPPDIEDVRGTIGGTAVMGGTVDHTTVRGEFRVSNGGFSVHPLDLTVEELAGPIRLNGTAIVLDSLTGRANHGTLELEGRLGFAGSGDRVDLTLSAAGVRVLGNAPDDLATAASAELGLEGPLARPLLSGRAVLRSVPPATGRASARTTAAHTQVPDVLATARGNAVLDHGGPISVRVKGEALPLSVLPWPRQVQGVTGTARGSIAVTGTIDDPELAGEAQLHGGGFRVPSLGLVGNDMTGTVHLEGGTLVVDGLTGRLGGGALTFEGRARLAADSAPVDVALTLDHGRVVDLDSAQVIASADLRLRGPIGQPHLTGHVAVIEGRVHEDLFQPSAALDLESPAYAELALEAPWPENSRLRRAARAREADGGPPITGEVVVDVGPKLVMVDEDSELSSSGRVRLRMNDEGLDARGTVRIVDGFYNFFGERFDVYGGAFRFTGPGLDPETALLAEHELEGSVWGRWGRGTLPERWPLLGLFAHGRASTVRENVRRVSLLPARQTDLAALLIYGADPQPVTGWHNPLLWTPGGPGEFFGGRAEAQGVSLAWSYIADEAYDYVSLDRGFLRGGYFALGSRQPARLVGGSLLRATAVLDENLALEATEPFHAATAPGLRLRFREGAFRIELFNEPRFFAAPAAGIGYPGYFYRRSTGITVRWRREF